MFYAWDITITAGTSEAEPKTEILKLSKGTITRIDVKFAPGCHRLVKVRILRWEFQLIPLNKDEWVTGDGEAVITEGFYELDTEPYQLKFLGCSPLTSYPHTVTVRVTVMPPEIATPHRILADLVKLFKRLLGM